MYTYFSEKGEEPLPDTHTINEYLNIGVQPTIFLDSCVCLHIIRVVDHGRRAKNVDFSRIISLKEYLHKNPDLRLSAFFALLELCSSKGTFDCEKFGDLKARLEFFEKIPLKNFRKFDYDFDRDGFVINRFPTIKGTSLEAVDQIVKNSYCTLLKIREISLRGITKNKAESNLNEFIDWMVNELDILRGAEYKLALNIFGGNTEFRKMIGLDNIGDNAKKKIMGSSWDMFHSKFVANSFRFFETFRENTYPYFLTSDGNLFKLFQDLNLDVVKDGEGEFSSSFIMIGDNYNLPHFNEMFMNDINNKLIDAFIDRSRHKSIYCSLKINKMIDVLEKQNGFL